MHTLIVRRKSGPVTPRRARAGGAGSGRGIGSDYPPVPDACSPFADPSPPVGGWPLSRSRRNFSMRADHELRHTAASRPSFSSWCAVGGRAHPLEKARAYSASSADRFSDRTTRTEPWPCGTSRPGADGSSTHRAASALPASGETRAAAVARSHHAGNCGRSKDAVDDRDVHQVGGPQRHGVLGNQSEGDRRGKDRVEGLGVGGGIPLRDPVDDRAGDRSSHGVDGGQATVGLGVLRGDIGHVGQRAQGKQRPRPAVPARRGPSARRQSSAPVVTAPGSGVDTRAPGRRCPPGGGERVGARGRPRRGRTRPVARRRRGPRPARRAPRARRHSRRGRSRRW